jgi:uncharacterized membrane protein YkvA (DUF1232 family)
MTKAKATSKARKAGSDPKGANLDSSHEKAAIRSEAFARAILDAKSHSTDREGLATLFQEAARKVATMPKEPLRDNWAYLHAMLRLIRAYSRGAYRDVPNDALLSIIAAISYLVDPFDLIPDEIPFLGFLDDATVIAFTLETTRLTLDDFMTWEVGALAGAATGR